jgi:hypothetical protein
MQRVLVMVLLAACGSEEGEPIEGTVAIDYGGVPIAPSVGAAIPDPDGDPDKALVIIGTRDVSCETRLETPLKRGTYLTFAVDRAPGTQAPFVAVIRVETGGAHLNGSAGEVIIDGIDGRVTGSLTFDTVDDEIGAITATGTFDVIDC